MDYPGHVKTEGYAEDNKKFTQKYIENHNFYPNFSKKRCKAFQFWSLFSIKIFIQEKQ